MSAQHTNRKESTPAETGTKTETEDNTFDSSRLPKVADRLTWPIVFVVIVGGAERFAFYAATAPWREDNSLNIFLISQDAESIF